MEKVIGMLIMILLEIYFLVLTIFSHLILIIAKIILILVFSILGEGDTFGINRSFSAPEKNFSKARRIFCLGFHYDGDNSLSVESK